MARRPLCSAAHTAVLIDVDKGVRPCCAFEGTELPGSPSLAVLGERTLDRIRSEPPWTTVRDQLARGEVPVGCVNCIERERLGGWSQRVSMEARRSPQWEQGITYLELSSSNICNLQCRHCSPLFSSRWSAHGTRLGHKVAPIVHPDGELLLRNLRSVDLSHLDYVVVKGGEPMLNSDFAVLLDHLEAIGVFGNVTVDMVTNGTVIDPDLLDRLRRVRELRVCLSVDGVGDVQTYVRHGSSSIERIEKAIAAYAALPNALLTRNTSVMVYNVFQLDRIDAWWDGLAARFPGNYMTPDYSLFVLWPEALALSCLQDHTRAALRAHYERVDRRRYAPVIRMLGQPYAGAHRHDEFVRWTLRVDGELGRSVLDAVPELRPELEFVDPDSPELQEKNRLEALRKAEAFRASLASGWQARERGELDVAAAVAGRLQPFDDLSRAAVLHLQAAIAAHRGDLVRAQSDLEQARALAPTNLSLRLEMARLLEALGRHDAALVHALAARADMALRPMAEESIARCRARLG